MDYDIIIVTANRPAMLALSIPTFLAQSRPPKRLIVIDASEDFEPVRRKVEELTAEVSNIEVVVERGPRGITRQRNVGIRYSHAPIIFFPDDDSLWRPDTAEETMRIYERDEEGVIGGVAQAATTVPPIKLPRNDEAARPFSERVKYRLAQARHRALDKVVTKPLNACGQALLADKTPPDWLDSAEARVIPNQPGFRMTFRRSALPDPPFNETLMPPRAALEDFDMSLTVLRTHLLVEATRAFAYHHRAPGPRAEGPRQGLNQFLNHCYVVCRHSPPGSKARQAIKPHARIFFLEQLLFRSLNKYGREKTRAMRLAMSRFDELLAASPESLSETYQRVFHECLERLGVMDDDARFAATTTPSPPPQTAAAEPESAG